MGDTFRTFRWQLFECFLIPSKTIQLFCAQVSIFRALFFHCISTITPFDCSDKGNVFILMMWNFTGFPTHNNIINNISTFNSPNKVQTLNMKNIWLYHLHLHIYLKKIDVYMFVLDVLKPLISGVIAQHYLFVAMSFILTEQQHALHYLRYWANIFFDHT